MTDIASAPVKIQIEQTRTNSPNSESLQQTIGGSVNYSVINSGKVGDVVMSMLDETTFQSLRDTTWVLMQGQSCAGTDFETLTGLSTLPDPRGRYARMKDNGAGVDPHGDLALGSIYADQFASHQHNATRDPNSGITGGRLQSGRGTTTSLVDASGGSETNPKTIIFNFFIKINSV